MGMFDTVLIEGLKLKTSATVDSFLKESNSALPTEFQTKDLENALITFKIDSNKQLWEFTPKETGRRVPYKPFRVNWTDNRSFLERIYFKFKFKDSKYGNIKTVPEVKHIWKKASITSTFDISSYDEINGRYLDMTFTVQTINGKVRSIVLKEANIETVNEAKKRKARNDEFDANMKKQFDRRNKLVSQWYYPVLKEIYNPFIFFTRIALQSICQALIAWSYRWKTI